MYNDKCPVCGSSNWQYEGTVVFIEDCSVNECYCEDCDSEWKEKFVFVENYDIVDKRPTK